MLQLSDIIQDPELGGAPFTILRDHILLQSGESVLESTDSLAAFGTVHPTADADLTLVPEEYRSETLFTFYAPILFSLGARSPGDPVRITAPDHISFDGRSFLVIAVKDWSPFGFSRAIAVEKKSP